MADESHDDQTRSHTVLTTGTLVSHYKIIEKIGAGGMGEVFLAEDTELDRKVALKFLPSYLCQDEDCRIRFKREAQAAAKLDHPNIIHIYEVSEFKGRPFFAMQHIEGQSLKDYSAGKDLSIEQILEIGIQICEGLQEAHEKGITHRDVKPSNILIDLHGRAKIVDFGLASVAGSEKLTKTGSTLGTIGYMSPEQVQGNEVDHRSDLFSLGVVLYELITKKNPFRRDSEAATLKAVSDDSPEPLARFKRDVPDDLQAVIDKALEKDVKTRHQTAGGMLADLMRVKRSLEPTHLLPSSAGKSSKIWWIAASLIIAAVIVVIVIIKPWQSGILSDQPEKIMLAVLPFENLGDPEDEYFADGITEEITSKLSKVKELGVIGSHSAKQYKKTDKSISQIGKELGVNYLLCGTVRWQKGEDESSKVRVTPQLIKVADASNVWSNIYEDLFTEIFYVQSSIANQVVSELDIALADSEKRAIEKQPTDNLLAYDFFIRARDYFWTWETRDDIEKAISFYQTAIALDSTFVDAWVELSTTLSFYHWAGWDVDGKKIEAAKQAADIALQYDSLDSYSHLAMGYYYYYGYRAYQKSLDELEYAAQRLPNNLNITAAIGYVQRRMGNWEESLASQIKAIQIEPLLAAGYYDIVLTARCMRRFDIAEMWLEKGLSLFPEYAWFHNERAQISMALMGDPKKALEELRPFAAIVDNSGNLQFQSMIYSYWADEIHNAIGYARRFFTTAETVSDTGWYYARMGDFYNAMGDSLLSRIYYDSARIYCDLRYSGIGPLNAATILPLGIVYAELGNPQKAVLLAQEQASLLPISKDALSGTDYLLHLAQTYVRVGKYDDAVEVLDTLLMVPSEITVPILRVDRDFAPLRNHSGFQALLNKNDNKN